MLTNIYRGDYDTDADIEPAILEATRDIFSRSVDKGIKQSHFDPSASFKKQIHHSAEVFSAFRVHTMTKEVVSRLHDDNGRLRSFSEFAEAVQPYVSHQNRAWLQTEYSTAVRRAHDAADWQQFEAEKDVLPNLRWMPSTSAKPGQDHMEFWGTVLPVDDPFWKEHRPGDRWNCKCSLSSTDDEPTSRPTAKESTPQPGLKTKPTDAELFSQDHPYYADSCTSCPFHGSKLMALLHDLSGKKDCNNCGNVNKKLGEDDKRKPFVVEGKMYDKTWKLLEHDEKSHGYMTFEDGHGKEETAQNRKSGMPLVRDGHRVELIKQRTIRIDGIKKKIKTRDANVDEQKWEFKYTEKYEKLSKSIGTKAEQAVLQGADYVLVDIVRTDNFSVQEVIDGTHNALHYNPELKGICLMIESRSYITIERLVYHDGTYIDKIRKWLSD